MSIRFKQLLQDCKDSLEWITEREEWNTLQDGSSAKDLIEEIEKVLEN